jgi:hypothetical protein
MIAPAGLMNPLGPAKDAIVYWFIEKVADIVWFAWTLLKL